MHNENVPRESLVDSVACRLIDSITSGAIGPDELLPSESELATTWFVSRLTIREAVKSLRVKQLVRVERGRGTMP